MKDRVALLFLGLLGWMFFVVHPAYGTGFGQADHPIHFEPTADPARQTSTPSPTTRLLFGGQIVPGRCVQAGVDERGNAEYIYANVRKLLNSADLTIASLNGSISLASPAVGCVDWSLMLNGYPLHADAMAAAGIDGLSVATNHINNCSLNNCGDRPFLDTLKNLQRVGIVFFGGGQNIEEALKPAIFTVNGVRFAFVSLGEIESNVFADVDRPGIAPLNERNLRKILREARKNADVVIFMPHWGSEFNPIPNPNQIKFARMAVEEGADLIIGSHTHVIQGEQMINGVHVFYGLGNFVFDQSWELRLRSSILVEVTFVGKMYRGSTIIPIVAAKDGTLSFPADGESEAIIANFINVSNKIKP